MQEVDFKFDFDRIIGISTKYTVYLIYSELIYNMEVESELLNKLRKRGEDLKHFYRELSRNYKENREFFQILRDELWDIERGISEEEGRIEEALMKKFIPEEYAIYN